MSMLPETKDSTALSDAEIEEMADLCAKEGAGFDIGTLSKQRDEWVLSTLVREDNHLRGFSFTTLERIGGTPCILLGLGFVRRSSKRDAVLKALMTDNYRRALMAFPDEDVLVGTRMVSADAHEAYKVLVDPNPRPGHEASGEERAWGRRLAKRFGVKAEHYDATAFTIIGDKSESLFFDHVSSRPETIDPAVAGQFDHLDVARGDRLVCFAWMMSEDLLKYKS